MAQLKGGSYVGGDFIVATDLSANVLKSLVATGTSPITVTSTTLVSNLNVQYLNGITSDVFATHRPEGADYIENSHRLYDDYRGGWRTASDLYVAYAYNSGTSTITNGINTGATLSGGAGWAYLRFTGNNRLWDIGTNQSDNGAYYFEIRPDGGDTNRFRFGNNGTLYATTFSGSGSGLTGVWLASGGWLPSGLSSTRLIGMASPDGGEFGLSYSSGQMYVYTDGFFYQNEGQYRVIDSSSIAGQSVYYSTFSGSLSSSNYISQRGSQGSWAADFQATPAGTMSYGGDLGASGSGGPGGSWWIQENFRHTNASNYWGVQVAWGWEDNANRLATRSISGGSYGGWNYYLHSNNFTTWAAPVSHTHDYATHRGEGTNFIDYARLTYNNGAYSGGPAWVEPSDLGVRYANTSGTASTVRQDFAGANVGNLLYSQMADNDYFRLQVGGTSTNAGFVEFATGDDGTEPFYFRQYTGVFGSVVRTLTLLDESGNTSFPGIVTINSALDSSFDNHNGALYVVGGIASGKSMQCHDLYTSVDASIGRDILVGGTGTFFGTSIEIGTNMSYLFMHDDDETSNAAKSVHANGNSIGFLNSAQSWLGRWDNGGTLYQYGDIQGTGSIRTDTYFKCTGDQGLCGGYDATGTTSKVIWTIGTSWATIGSMYGLGYEYGGVSGYGHGLFMANAGNRTIHFDLSGGNAYYNGAITASNFVLNSDARIKHNIYPIQTRDSGIKFMEFELNSTPGVKRYGVIAQQLLELGHYELVEGNDEDTYKVKYIDLIIKELAFLKSELSNVKNELFELKNKSI